MSVEVYIWSHSRNSSWGHAACQVRPGPYISWWPHATEQRVFTVDKKKHPTIAKIMQKFIGTTNVYKVKHSTTSNLLQDVTAEGRNPQQRITIVDGVLDEEAIARWWTGYNHQNASFHSIKKNCSTTVIRALRAGGADRYAKLAADWFSKRSGWEPTDVLAYLRRMARSAGEGKMTFTENPSFEAESMLVQLNTSGGGDSGGGGNLCIHGVNMYECTNC